MKHQARIVRFWILAVAAVAISLCRVELSPWLFSSFAAAPFGLLMPVFSSGCPQCSAGTQDLTSIQADVAGVANNLCSDCANLNTTFILAYSGGVSCFYRRSGNFTLCGSPSEFLEVDWYWYNATVTNAYFEMNDHGATGIVNSFPSLSYPRDCSDGSDLVSLDVRDPDGHSPFARCDYSAATVTLTP